uniref:Uncharacterized protein n=1 Tax=Ditylenchus dipsaci TaxID=166011 RepID=A0A915DKW1_9BILA
MLIQRLSFPRHLAHEYGTVLCRFFDSFKSEYNSPVTDNFHEVFRVNGVHNYIQDEDNFQALQSPDYQNRQFDTAFFQKVLGEFIK